MTSKTALQLLYEFLWLGLTVILAALAVWPIYNVIWQQHVLLNFLIALLFFNLFRWLINFKGIIYFQWFVFRIIFLVLNVIVFFTLYDKLKEGLFLMDNYDLSIFVDMSKVESGDAINSISKIYKKEFIFFLISALMLQVIFGFRLIVSFFDLIRKIR